MSSVSSSRPTMPLRSAGHNEALLKSVPNILQQHLEPGTRMMRREVLEEEALLQDGLDTLVSRENQKHKAVIRNPDVQYVTSDDAAPSCPAGSTHIMDYNTCKEAGNALTYSTAASCIDYGGGHHGADGELGCYVNLGNNCVHFNVDKTTHRLRCHSTTSIFARRRLMWRRPPRLRRLIGATTYSCCQFCQAIAVTQELLQSLQTTLVSWSCWISRKALLRHLA